MANCYHCGDFITFINNGSGPIPIHSSGSCGGRGGGYGYGQGYSSIRSTSQGQAFDFPFITYPSYVIPNAKCPVCGASVYFYQSPYGGRVYFDELGPPWPKHPCTDNSDMRYRMSPSESRSRFLGGFESSPSQSPLALGGSEGPLTMESAVDSKREQHVPAWCEANWMPFVVTKIVQCSVGIEAEGRLFEKAGSDPIRIRIHQKSPYEHFYRSQGRIQVGFSLVQNPSPVLSALNESPVLLKKDTEPQQMILSTFNLSSEGEVHEITLSVTVDNLVSP